MNPDAIVTALTSQYANLSVVEAWGETSLFYNPGLRLPRGVYFATIKQKDGDNDHASHLDRDGVFRLNIGTSKNLFMENFGQLPSRPKMGGVVSGDWDFSVLNQLMPHPIYGWMSWVAVNNPDTDMFIGLAPVLDAAYQKAIITFQKR